jgi:hypothetical protein
VQPVTLQFAIPSTVKCSCFLFTKQDKSVRNILQQHDTSTLFLLSPADFC